MKKMFSLLLALSLLFSLSAFAETASSGVHVFVSITDDIGALKLAAEPVFVTDQDGDGTLTLHDALLCAHIAHHKNGAEGYIAVATEYGMSLVRLWGIENGGSFGYYLNDASAWSLLDPVAEGDHVKAYAFTDLAAWSDTYCYFDALTLDAQRESSITLTLSAAAFDAAYNPITLPVEGAVITVNGETTEIKTDAEGKAVITLTESGKHVISAISETQTLVAPVCVITVGDAQ